MRSFLRKWGGWISSIAAALALCGAVVWYERDRIEHDLLYRLCDGFFVAGVLLAGLGLLTWIANFGGFTALGYAVHVITHNRFSSEKRFEERLSYLEYVQLYGEKKKRKPNCVIATGAACIAVAFVLLCLWR